MCHCLPLAEFPVSQNGGRDPPCHPVRPGLVLLANTRRKQLSRKKRYKHLQANLPGQTNEPERTVRPFMQVCQPCLLSAMTLQ